MILVATFVPGAAKTKGSMVVRNRATGAMKESVEGSSTWRALMAQAVRDDIARRHRDVPCAHLLLPYAGAVAVAVSAYLTPPPGHEADEWPTWDKAGDLDKIVRNVLDALGSRSKNPHMNGGAIVDDNLVCILRPTKLVARPERDPGQRAGVFIQVETL